MKSIIINFCRDIVLNKIGLDKVESLVVDVHPDLLDIVRFHKPTKGFRGKFSIDYVLAGMLLDHKVDLNL